MCAATFAGARPFLRLNILDTHCFCIQASITVTRRARLRKSDSKPLHCYTYASQQRCHGDPAYSMSRRDPYGALTTRCISGACIKFPSSTYYSRSTPSLSIYLLLPPFSPATPCPPPPLHPMHRLFPAVSQFPPLACHPLPPYFTFSLSPAPLDPSPSPISMFHLPGHRMRCCVKLTVTDAPLHH